MNDILKKDITSLHKMLVGKEISAVELTKTFLAHAKAENARLNSFITICENEALRTAEACDKKIAEGKNVTKLTGIPIGLKDIFCTKGIKTTCGSKMLANYVPPYNATVVEKLEAAGAVVIGKLNMDEFAMGSSNEFSAFGPVKNPHDETRIPGGSSGGSAASVAANQCVATLGTDTGGSIRQPAAMCGVVGIKPTYGRVSRYGMIAFASSLDQAGPMANNVRDAAIMLGAISGHDSRDATSLRADVPDFEAALTGDIKGLKIGIPKEYFSGGLDTEVAASIKAAIEKIHSLGATTVEATLPSTDFSTACYYIVAPAEASANLARFDGIRYGHRAEKFSDLDDLYSRTRAEGFGDEVKLRIMIGTFVLSSGFYDAYYKKAQQVRTLIKNDFDAAFKKYDLLLAPTTPTPAFKIGEKIDDPLTMYLSDIFTIPANLAGLPAMNVPCGKTNSGLPIGMQLIGRPMDEATILKVAHAYEQA